MRKVLVSLILFVGLFIVFLIAHDYKAYHEIGDIINYPPKRTYKILDIIQEVNFLNATPPIFNGCIAKHSEDANKFFLTYRVTLNDFTPQRHSYAGLFILDDKLRVQQNHSLDLISKYNLERDIVDHIKDPEDVRVLVVKGITYLFYHAEYHGERAMFIATLAHNDSQYKIDNIHHLRYQPVAHLPQKNWTPFAYQDEIYLIYSADPTKVLHYDPISNKVDHAYTTNYPRNTLKRLWPYGELRGGTPAIYIPELNAYLTFFHSHKRFKSGEPSLEKREPLWRIYYMGAYIFENKPPFKILAITKLPLTYQGMYDNLDTNFHIIFPCGFVTEKDKFIVSNGVDDSKLVLLEINKSDLYSKLKWLNK